jgi:hypothetical protein
MRLVESRQRARSYGNMNRYGLCRRRSVIYDTMILNRDSMCFKGRMGARSGSSEGECYGGQ